MPRTQIVPEELTKLYHITGDEACTGQEKWLVIGITVISDEHVDHVRAKFLAMKKMLGLPDEVKWVKCTHKNLPRYKRLANVILYLIERDIINFHSIAIFKAVVDNEKYNEGIPEIGFNKFVYHLLRKWARRYPAERKYLVQLDERTSNVPIDTLTHCLNFGVMRDYKLDHFPFRRTRYANSKSDVLFEINDLLVGAVGFEMNRKHKPPVKSVIKAELAKHIRKGSGLWRFGISSGPQHKRFTTWRFEFNDLPGKKSRRAPRKKKIGARGPRPRKVRASPSPQD